MRKSRIIAAVVILLTVVCTIISCKTQTTAVLKQTSTQKDSLQAYSLDSLVSVMFKKDSVQIHDSVYVFSTPDTTIIYKEHHECRYILLQDEKNHTHADTTNRVITKIDSIPYPVEVEKIKYKSHVPWYTQGLAFIGLCAVLLFIIQALISKYKV